MLLLPKDIGIRVAAVALLDHAHAAAKALVKADDPDELHDFRVALRRLRSWMRAFKLELSDGVSKKQRRQLKDIAAATNAGRDFEVLRDWMRDAAKGRSARRKRGAKWMIQHMKDAADDSIDVSVAEGFRDVRDDLEARLSICSVNVRQLADMSSLAGAIAERIPTHSAALKRALSKIATVDDEDEAHQARITAKRLRYLIEPGAPLVKSGAVLLQSLRSLQSELGTLHDAHIIGREIHRALEDGPAGASRESLETINTHVGDAAKAAFASVRRHWLRGRYARLDQSVARFARRLAKL